MKAKIILTTIMLFCNGFLSAQTITIPDANFKNALIAKGVDTNGNGTIQISEALAVTNLNVSSSNITDLTGISSFTNLQILNCSNNQLTAIDFTGLNNLKNVNCSSNQLTALNLSGKIALTNIISSPNLITDYNVSGCTALTALGYGTNPVATLNASNTGISSFTSISNVPPSSTFTTIKLSNCAALQSININNNDLLNDLQINGCAALTSISVNYNNLLPTLDASNFTNLTTVNCYGNPLLSNLITSGSSAITTLNCYSNALTALSLSDHTDLQTLNCSNNQLTAIDFTGLNNLKTLICSSNQLTALNLSGKTALTSISSSPNLIANYNVSGCTALTALGYGNNPVATLNASNTGISSFTSISNVPPSSTFTTINLSNCAALQSININNNDLLNDLQINGCAALTSISVNNNNLLQTLDASNFTNLTTVNCYGNPLLSNLITSGSSAITTLNCYSNALTALSLSDHTDLQTLNCSNNQLTAIDFTGLNNLKTLICSSNQLTALNLSGKTALTSISSSPNLITNDNVSGCTALTALGYGTNPVATLNASNTGISSFTSISNVPPSSTFTTINLSNSAALESININNNDLLNDLQINGCAALTSISVNNNNLLPTLNASNFANLTTLNCYGNPLLSNLTITGATALMTLNCYSNNLSTLDATGNPNLTSISCSNNNIVGIDLRNGTSNTINLQATGNTPLSSICIDGTDTVTGNWSNGIVPTYSPAPTGAVEQAFCNTAKINNLFVTGSNIQWYSAASGGVALDPATDLETNTFYYASQTTASCESLMRLKVKAIINTGPTPTASATQVFCNSATVANLVAAGTAVDWYTSSIGGSALTASTLLVNNSIYYASETLNNCESASRLAVTAIINLTPATSASATQEFCNTATVNNLLATGTAVKWYANATGGIALSSGTVLVNNSVYHASQTLNECESAERFAVTVTVNPKVTPTFTQVNPICSGATLAALPATSTNGISGTWSPTVNNMTTTSYTFTPTSGQCASVATMTITVNPIVTPTFTQVNPISSGGTLANLPTTSINGIAGTWSPALNNTATTLYTFTPNAGQCATVVTMTITVNSIVTPTFTQVNSICSGATLAALPTTSNNGITGTWSPALNNSVTTLYTFTPNAEQNASNTTMTITVDAKVTPTFTQVNPTCSEATLAALPTTSTNGISGTWSPTLNNTATTLYTFTPESGQCASVATITITVNPIVTPTFTQVNPISSGGTLANLPTTSINGIAGTWSPALNNTTTTLYTFTPNAGQCATVVTMTITVNSIVTPTFTQVDPICSGATLAALPTTSTNGISGTWSPALNNSVTTLYTFTPNAEQNASNTTMTITVDAKVTPTFTQVNPICSEATLAALPTTSTNGISGTWSPTLNNTATTLYTFTPESGQCASVATMTITVNPIVTPTFTQVNPISSGGTLANLPTTSTNGIAGTWSPALNNTATTFYTFTPNAGQCATVVTMTITVNSIVTPTFTQVNSICSGATLAALPTTSSNGITGTWSPTLNNTATTLYTFTPESGQCASVATITITVNPIVTPTFTQVNPISSGGTLANLPTTSINGIAGTWSPALNNTTTTLYTFTPNAGQCATVVTMTITVNSIVTPTFTQVNPICSGATLAALPTTSSNGITGTWSPALNNSVTTLYTFTPNGGQNASNTTMTITVNAIPAPPTIVATVGTCSTNAMLVVTNFNSALTYTSAPQGAVVNNSGIISSAVPGTEYTFTASNASCTSNSSQPITLLPQTSQTGLPTLSTITAAPVCAGNTTNIVLSGLLTSTFGTATYKIGNGAPLTTSGTTSASGTFSFQTPILSAQANGLIIEITKMSTAAGCETIFTGKTVTLIVNKRPTLNTVTAAPACIGGKTNIVLSGLLPNMSGIATYKIGNGTPLTQAGTSSANGMFIFQTPLLPAAANGLMIEITKLSYANGCETTFVGKKVTLVVQNCSFKNENTEILENQDSTLSAADYEVQEFDKIRIYPNPTSDVLNIDTSAVIESIRIFNMQGQMIISTKKKQIIVSDLPDGVYLIRIQDSDNNVISKKFIKKYK